MEKGSSNSDKFRPSPYCHFIQFVFLRTNDAPHETQTDFAVAGIYNVLRVLVYLFCFYSLIPPFILLLSFLLSIIFVIYPILIFLPFICPIFPFSSALLYLHHQSFHFLLFLDLKFSNFFRAVPPVLSELLCVAEEPTVWELHLWLHRWSHFLLQIYINF
jgi:hypothetical protein